MCRLDWPDLLYIHGIYSYKISTAASDRGILIDPNFRPEGIFELNFFKPGEKNAT